MELKKSLRRLGEKSSRVWSKNGSKILTGIGLFGMATAIGTAITATPKAVKALEAKKAEENVEKLPAKTIVKTTWKYYIIPFSTFVLSSVCIVCSDKNQGVKEAAAIATANFYRSAAEELRANVVETIGEEKTQEIERKASVKKISKEDVENAIVTPEGTYLCKEEFSGQLFRSSEAAIEKALLDLNWKLETDMCVSLNTFYSMLNIPETTVGGILGWQYLNYDEDERVGIHSWTEMVHGEPCYIFQYTNEPRTEYNVFG